jgi:hypothetical protein
VIADRALSSAGRGRSRTRRQIFHSILLCYDLRVIAETGDS